jgi:uncharacterized membrane protein YfcA
LVSTASLFLGATSLLAATVNGAIGYGYSSISVPLALFVVIGRVLSPALVLVEVAINLYALLLCRKAARRMLPRVLPLVLGIIPGVIAGAWLLSWVKPGDVKLGAFVVLLPLILFQASGRRWPVKRERLAGTVLGGGVGLLYGLTTVSGPPLALFWNNQGLGKDDFKVGLAVARVAESLFALAAYAWLGLFTRDSLAMVPVIVPGILIGMPLGHWLVRRLNAETFRRICMSFDAYLVSLGLARAIVDAQLAVPALAYQLVAVTALVDGWLLYNYFRGARRAVPLGLGVGS